MLAIRRLSLIFPIAVVVLLCASIGVTAQEDDDFYKELKKKKEAESGGSEKEDPEVSRKEAAPEKSEPEAVAPEDGVALEGKRVQLAEIPSGSWCAGGENLIREGDTVTVASVTITGTKKGVALSGHFKTGKAKRKRQGFKPSEFRVTVVDGVEKLDEENLSSRDLKKGVDVEVCDDTLMGVAIIRIEESWQGVIWGVTTGWEFKLAKESITLVDADFNGACSIDDRVIYGERNLWMPWHTVTLSGETIYYEIKIANSHALTARTKKMEDPGDDRAVWDAWQEERKNQGVPPGLFSQKRKEACIKHAEYLKINKARGHDEDPGKPGYNEATKALESLVLHKQIATELDPEHDKRDRYGRILAYVIIMEPAEEGVPGSGGNININVEMVKRGHSAYFTKYGKSSMYAAEFISADQK